MIKTSFILFYCYVFISIYLNLANAKIFFSRKKKQGMGGGQGISISLLKKKMYCSFGEKYQQFYTQFKQSAVYMFLPETAVHFCTIFLPQNDILNHAKKIKNVKLKMFDLKWFVRVMSMERMSIEVEVDLFMFQEELVVILFIKLGFRFIIYLYIVVISVCLSLCLFECVIITQTGTP